MNAMEPLDETFQEIRHELRLKAKYQAHEVISPSKLRVYVAICNYHDEHGMPPTYRELAKALGYGGLGWVFRAVRDLKAAGLVRTEGQRTITPIARVMVYINPLTNGKAV